MPKEWRGKPVYQVNEIVRLLSSELEQAFGDIWVEGEVSGFKRAASGHCYFSLKDESSALKSVMFRTYAARLPFEPENGMTVLARGKLSLYEASGDLQLYVTFMEPSGVGAMQMAFEQAKRRLMEEGLTDPGRKRPIPPFPRRVGVVTSVTGAASEGRALRPAQKECRIRCGHLPRARAGRLRSGESQGSAGETGEGAGHRGDPHDAGRRFHGGSLGV